MKEVTKTIFESDDGVMFDNAADCAKHEKVIAKRAERTTYWSITSNPDLTEGRGWYGLTLVECYGPDTWNAKVYMEDYCYRTFGRPVAFVQGCSPMDNWKLHQIELASFRRPDPSISVGDYQYKANYVRLIIGDKQTGLIEAGDPPA